MNNSAGKYVEGFSKWSKDQKIEWIKNYYLQDKSDVELLRKYWHPDKKLQEIHDGFVENPISNYYLPFSIAPNFLINGITYAVPMVIEESSVVAAAAKGAKFWYPHGGFHAEVISTVKTGHIHLFYYNEFEKLKAFFLSKKAEYLNRLKPFTENMEKRGGGILSVELQDKTASLPNYYVIAFKFDTVDSMGANFINTILEEWSEYMEEDYPLYGQAKDFEIIMRILSNYNPECRVKVQAEASIKKLKTPLAATEYVNRFIKAVHIAQVNTYRAVTHNKGIMNGIDAVILATGNDFRAVEAGIHAYASNKGQYKSVSEALVENDKFIFRMEIPLAIGVVGGLTQTHPLAKTALKILQNPSAKELMKIVASVGLAQNFSAVNSLITEGIQKGHMKMHLTNILLQLEATEEETKYLKKHFENKKVHIKAVKEELQKLRNNK